MTVTCTGKCRSVQNPPRSSAPNVQLCGHDTYTGLDTKTGQGGYIFLLAREFRDLSSDQCVLGKNVLNVRIHRFPFPLELMALINTNLIAAPRENTFGMVVHDISKCNVAAWQCEAKPSMQSSSISKTI